MNLGTLALHLGRLVTVIAQRKDGLVVVTYRENRRVEVALVLAPLQVAAKVLGGAIWSVALRRRAPVEVF